MNLYKHEGSGHYIGSYMIVWADTLIEAKTLIRIELDEAGLQKERVDVVEVPMVRNSFVLSVNGDY